MSPIWVALAGVSPATATFYRCAYAIPALLIIWFVGRKRDTRSPRARLMAFANGIILAADLTIWHYSIELIGAGLSTVLANIQVVFVGVLAWLFHRERPTRVAFQMIPVILVGATLISGLAQDDAYGKAPVAGAILGVTSGLLYASFMLILRASNRILAPPAGPLLDSSVGGAITALALGPLLPGFDLNIHMAEPRLSGRARARLPSRGLALHHLCAPTARCTRDVTLVIVTADLRRRGRSSLAR